MRPVRPPPSPFFFFLVPLRRSHIIEVSKTTAVKIPTLPKLRLLHSLNRDAVYFDSVSIPENRPITTALPASQTISLSPLTDSSHVFWALQRDVIRLYLH